MTTSIAGASTGVFNFEGGCYAKFINLSREDVSEVYEANRRFSTLLENVAINNKTRRIDLDDSSLTEKTLATYSITYIPLLGDKIAKHDVAAWLINTGWSGEPHGERQSIKLSLTHAMVSAVLSGILAEAETRPHPTFDVSVPLAVPGVPSEVLDTRKTWKTWKDHAVYD